MTGGWAHHATHFALQGDIAKHMFIVAKGCVKVQASGGEAELAVRVVVCLHCTSSGVSLPQVSAAAPSSIRRHGASTPGSTQTLQRHRCRGCNTTGASTSLSSVMRGSAHHACMAGPCRA